MNHAWGFIAFSCRPKTLLTSFAVLIGVVGFKPAALGQG